MKLTATWLEQECVLSLEGAGNLEASQQVKAHLSNLTQNKNSGVTIDLSRCWTMNSVFVGTLLGASLRLQETSNQKLTLAGLSDENKRVIKTLGIRDSFVLKSRIQLPPSRKVLAKRSRKSRLSTAKHFLEAHVHLANKNLENRERFQAVVDLFQEDIRKLQKKRSRPRSGRNKSPLR